MKFASPDTAAACSGVVSNWSAACTPRDTLSSTNPCTNHVLQRAIILVARAVARLGLLYSSTGRARLYYPQKKRDVTTGRKSSSRAGIKLGGPTRPGVRAKVARALAAEAVVQAQRAGRAGVGGDTRAVLLEQQAHVAHQVRLAQQRGYPPLALACDAARGGVVGAKRAHGVGQVGKTRRQAPQVHLVRKSVSVGSRRVASRSCVAYWE
eukprot:scaffold80887_cov75-Phaeocystis_antarctica.AAC.5